MSDHENNFNHIRLAAATQVLLVHAINHFNCESPIANVFRLFPGVPIFFFISGYLIYQSFDRMKVRRLTDFYRNRFLRIYPGLFVCVIVSVASVYLAGFFTTNPVAPRKIGLWIVAQTTAFQFYNPEFMRGYGVGVLNGALWTISVELQFYLLVPILNWLLAEKVKTYILLGIVSVGVNLFIRTSLRWESLPMKLLYVSFLPWIYMFMCGFAAARWGKVKNALQQLGFPYLLGGYVASMLVLGSYKENASNAINVLSFVLLAALLLKLAWTPLPLPRTVILFLQRADFSYGLYLYHMPIVNFLIATASYSFFPNLGILMACCVVAAACSWFLVERPALRFKR